MLSRRELVPLSEAAKLLEVDEAWLRREVEEQRLPGLRAGNSYVVHPTQLLSFLTERLIDQGKLIRRRLRASPEPTRGRRPVPAGRARR